MYDVRTSCVSFVTRRSSKNKNKLKTKCAKFVYILDKKLLLNKQDNIDIVQLTMLYPGQQCVFSLYNLHVSGMFKDC